MRFYNGQHTHYCGVDLLINVNYFSHVDSFNNLTQNSRRHDSIIPP